MYKMVICVRQDLKLPKGKMAAQVAHAAVECALKADKKKLQSWLDEGQKKSVVKVKDQNELMEVMKKAKLKELTTGLIKDAGKTVVEPGTITCLGIGPDREEIIDTVSGNLTLM